MVQSLSHIVAASENNAIGINGKLPWRLPDDFKFFKDTTWAMPIIMGRNTFESMEGDLPGRINIVVTTNKDWKHENAFVTHDIPAAIEKAKEADTREIFIIGGGQIFKETMDLIKYIYITRVHVTIEGDTIYPEIDPGKWKKISEKYHSSDERHNYAFTFETWERK